MTFGHLSTGVDKGTINKVYKNRCFALDRLLSFINFNICPVRGNNNQPSPTETETKGNIRAANIFSNVWLRFQFPCDGAYTPIELFDR